MKKLDNKEFKEIIQSGQLNLLIGSAWKSVSKLIREAFNHNEYLFSLNMLENDTLKFLLK